MTRHASRPGYSKKGSNFAVALRSAPAAGPAVVGRRRSQPNATAN
ncbi:hypothetical protein PSNTI_27590 [Stutzerimonas stutzeri]|nr:hypothetical protein PSNTI_27590 [Stutzerimonas stutzeri]